MYLGQRGTMQVVRALSLSLLFPLLLMQSVEVVQTHKQPLDSVIEIRGKIPSELIAEETNAKALGNAADTSATTSASTSGSTLPTTSAPPQLVPRVSVPDLGTAIGTTLQSFDGRDFYAFMSIPYALAPEGERRFKYPEKWTGLWPKETDDGEYEAVFLRARCIQQSLILNMTGGREDCLHLSIYTPVLPEETPTTLLPVMVWFHGGAYMTGDANLYVPSKLMDRDVMVVVVQYRLGLLGFLAGGTDEAPGNMGLMDQIMSLRWVQDYIEYFGGNSSRVTVFGQSAGGASSSLLQITPLTNGSAPENKGNDLFHGVIPQSGSALEVWTIDPKPQEGFDLAVQTLGCEGEPDIMTCMRGKTAAEVNGASNLIYITDRRGGGLGFKALCPVVQSDLAEAFPNMEIVIPNDPQEMLANGTFMRVPMMAGSVRDEGSLVVGLSYKDYMFYNGYEIDDVDFVKYETVKTLLNAFGLSDQNGAVANTMRVGYFPDAELGNWTSMVGGLIDMTGVMFLKSGLWEVAKAVNRVDPDVPIYFYSWEFESDDSLFPWIFISMLDVPVPGGISHADELLYLFHLPSDLDTRQRNMTRKMITLWTNFAKYGNPTPSEIDDPADQWEGMVSQWELFDNEDYKFMLINDDFVIDQDFTSRWHHDRDIHETQVTELKKLEEETITPDTSSYVLREDYEAEVKKAHSLKVAAGVFEGFAALTVIVGCIFVIFQRQATRANGIV